MTLQQFVQRESRRDKSVCGHFASSRNLNVRIFQCTTSGGTVGGGSLPCAISNFTNYEPDFITFDLSFGYKTGDLPANVYLKNLTLQLTIQNLLNRHSPFDYIPTTAGGRQVTAYDLTRPNSGRTIGVTLVKNW